jgi:hypothetical protein
MVAMPGGFPLHLCQPDTGKSCSACCGIYNFVRNDPGSTRQRLRHNTLVLKAPEASLQMGLPQHTRHFRSRYNGSDKLFATIFNCEFVGFLDEKEKRVGCLLHPEVCPHDLRDRSFYGRELCDSHFCLSYYYLTASEQDLVIHCLDDWYLYGLVITDIDLVKGYYEALSNRLGETVSRRHLRTGPLKTVVNDFFRWKLHWPFRSNEPARFGKYRFHGDEYREVHIPYERWQREPSRYDIILMALGSEFRDAIELEQAESLLDEAVERFVRMATEGNVEQT